MLLRQFNSHGIERYRENLAQCRTYPQHPVRSEILEDSSLTQTIDENIGIAHQVFHTKGEAGEYLHDLLDPILPHEDIISNVGLWSWLSLFFFESVCPQDKQSGKRRVNDDCHYIYDPTSWNQYRHLLFTTWWVLDITKAHHRLITTTKINVMDRVTEEIMKRLYLLRIPCIFEVLDRIYWNDATNSARKGITSPKKRGNLRSRFPTVIQQLEKTYDIQSLKADQLLELLGDEFVFHE